MKNVVLALLLLSAIGPRQDVPAAPAEAEAKPGALEIERGFVSARKGWYQDLFGLAVQSPAGAEEKLELIRRWESAEILLVDLHSWDESGINLELRFRFVGEHVVECHARGRWRYDFGFEPSDFSGVFENVTGSVRVYQRDTRNLACLFVIHGVVTRGHKEVDPPELVMGGFEFELPSHATAGEK